MRKWALIFTLLFISYHISFAQGQLWGFNTDTRYYSNGLIAKTDGVGNDFSIEHIFDFNTSGYSIAGNLYLGKDKKIYGIMTRSTSQWGAVFSYDPNTLSTESFVPPDSLKFFPGFSQFVEYNGKLYGTASFLPFTAASRFSIFEFDLTTHVMTRKKNFDPIVIQQDGLALHANGKMYGTTSAGSNNSQGTVFEYDPVANTLTKIADFLGADTGAGPIGALALGPDGMFYGATTSGGIYNAGTLVRFDAITGILTKIFDFNAGSPKGTLLAASNGRLYGVLRNGKNVIYEYDIASGTFTTLGDYGDRPYYNPVQSQGMIELNGVIYGLNILDGYFFEYQPSTSVLSKLYQLNADQSDGYFISTSPLAVLDQNGDMLLFGASLYGGNTTNGTLFHFNLTQQAFKKDLDFFDLQDGGNPINTMSVVDSVTLVGVTSRGGKSNRGVIFDVDPLSGKYRKRADLASFNLFSPAGGLTQGPDKKYYGLAITYSTGSGTIYQYDPATAQITPINSPSWMTVPIGKMTLANDGHLYGLTYTATVSTYNNCSIFDFDPSTGTISQLYTFIIPGLYLGGHDGGLISASNGKLYGLLSVAGTNKDGILFEFDPLTNACNTLVHFNALGCRLDDGFRGSLGIQTKKAISLVEVSGKLYGTAQVGGNNNYGTLFEFDMTTNTATIKFHFDGANGITPSGNLTLSPNGRLYGATLSGGLNNRGILFEYDPTTNSFIKKKDFDSAGGAVFGSQLLFTKSYQSIFLGAPVAKFRSDEYYPLPEKTSVGLPINYSTSDTNIGVVRNDTLWFTGSGQVTIRASHPGNDYYYGAQPVTQVITILKKNQDLLLPTSVTSYRDEITYLLPEYTSAGLRVSYTSSDTAIAIMEGNTLRFISTGEIIVQASQAGNDYYNPVEKEIIVNILKKDQLISFLTIENKGFQQSPFSLTASASSGLPVTFSIDSDKIIIDANEVFISKPGRVSIIATQNGNDYFNAAIPVTQSFCIYPPIPTLQLVRENGIAKLQTSKGYSSYQWYYNDILLPEVITSDLIPSAIGTYQVMVSADDCPSEQAHLTITTCDLLQPGLITLFPNPADDVITLQRCNSKQSEAAEIYNVLGALVRQFIIENDETQIDISNLAPGLYTLRTKNDRLQFVVK